MANWLRFNCNFAPSSGVSAVRCHRKTLLGADEFFDCPRFLLDKPKKRFCCGPTSSKYCCEWSDSWERSTQGHNLKGTAMTALFSTLLVIGSLIACCCCCGCWLLSKRRQSRGQVLGKLIQLHGLCHPAPDFPLFFFSRSSNQRRRNNYSWRPDGGADGRISTQRLSTQSADANAATVCLPGLSPVKSRLPVGPSAHGVCGESAPVPDWTLRSTARI
jgi:hypothetical protein